MKVLQEPCYRANTEISGLAAMNIPLPFSKH